MLVIVLGCYMSKAEVVLDNGRHCILLADESQVFCKGSELCLEKCSIVMSLGN